MKVPSALRRLRANCRCTSIRVLAALLAGLIVASANIRPASAALEVDVTRGTIQPLPIAVPAFVASATDVQLGADVANVIAADLKRSGLFQPLEPASFIQATVDPNQAPNFGDWRIINAR
jgi:TolB protein